MRRQTRSAAAVQPETLAPEACHGRRLYPCSRRSDRMPLLLTKRGSSQRCSHPGSLELPMPRRLHSEHGSTHRTRAGAACRQSPCSMHGSTAGRAHVLPSVSSRWHHSHHHRRHRRLHAPGLMPLKLGMMQTLVSAAAGRWWRRRHHHLTHDSCRSRLPGGSSRAALVVPPPVVVVVVERHGCRPCHSYHHHRRHHRCTSHSGCHSCRVLLTFTRLLQRKRQRQQQRQAFHTTSWSRSGHRRSWHNPVHARKLTGQSWRPRSGTRQRARQQSGMRLQPRRRRERQLHPAAAGEHMEDVAVVVAVVVVGHRCGAQTVRWAAEAPRHQREGG